MLFTHVRHDGVAVFFHAGHGAREVHVTGSFSDWKYPGVPLRRIESGFVAEVGPVPNGDVQYKFVVDGRWSTDPANMLQRDGNSLLHHGRARGSVHVASFRSPALDRERGYAIYLPPAHDDGRRFPVLYLLHGALDWERTWVEKGAFVDIIETLRAQSSVGDMIVVMPAENGDLFRGDGRVVEYLARDVVGHIDHEFPTMADSRHRALDGLSTGGFTSVFVGVSRPAVFGSIGCMSGSHDGRTFDLIAANRETIGRARQRYLVSSGRDEEPIEAARSVARALADAGAHAEFAEVPGGHDWDTWRVALPAHLRFHWQTLADSPDR